jgi:hypothetical protein
MRDPRDALARRCIGTIHAPDEGMIDIETVASEPDHAGSMTVHDRNVLAARLFVACGVLFGPTLLVLALIVFALHRGEQTRPWSHRSIACATPHAAVVDSDRARHAG